MGRSKKRKTDQRIAIIDEAGLLFWEKGYESTSMRDIARACGFEPGNIYNYFASKEQLLYEVFRATIGPIVDSIKKFEDDTETNQAEQLRSVIKISTEAALRTERTSRLLPDAEMKHLSSAHRKKIVELRDAYDRVLRKVIRRGIESNNFIKTDDQIAAYAIASIILRSRIWYSETGRLSPEQIALFFSDLVLNGLKRRLNS